MKVSKFGGSSLASAHQVRKVCEIIAADPERRLVVVSAPGKRDKEDIKVTDLLIEMAQARLSKKNGAEELSQIVDRYGEIAKGHDVPVSSINAIAEDLRNRLTADIHNEDLYLETIKAAGEDNCAKLIVDVLRARGIEANYVSPKEAGMTLSDEPGNAQVLKKSYERLRLLRDRPGVTIFPGFFGYSDSGNVVTFPRGGSDITGAILARAVNAEVYENFTDVDSVFAANPTIIDHPVPIRELTFREMRELSYAGFSVFHDEALEPVFHAEIPVNILNTNNPKAPGTQIVTTRELESDRPVVGIAAIDEICSIYVSKYLMNREIGFGRQLLEILENEAISFEHAPSGIDNMSIILRESSFSHDVETRVTQRIRKELNIDDVSVERGLALVMIVGEGMNHSVGIAARACAAFAHAGVNIEMINQGSSEVSMMFGVKAEDMQATVQSLYREFFE